MSLIHTLVLIVNYRVATPDKSIIAFRILLVNILPSNSYALA